MSNKKLISIALMIAGIGLAIWGYQESTGASSQFSSAFTGSFSDRVMQLYIAAAVSFGIGFFLFKK